jgi:cobalamin biosynthesis Mg chelatase CobN
MKYRNIQVLRTGVVIIASISIYCMAGAQASEGAPQITTPSLSRSNATKGRKMMSLSSEPMKATATKTQSTRGSLLKDFEANEALRAQTENGTNDLMRSQVDRVRTAEADYDVFVFQNRRENLEWQVKASKWIFGIVVTIVLSGLLLAIWQFFRTPQRPFAEKAELPEGGDTSVERREISAVSGQPEASQSATSFEATASGIKVSSPILGVIILAMSMVFFYLYVVKVYPITEIGHQSDAEASPAAK